MNILDIALLVVTSIGLILGYKAGIVKQLSFGAGIAIGLLQAMLFYKQGGEALHALTEWDKLLCTILAFVLILLATATVLIVLGKILRWLLEIILLGIIDSILGALLSAVISVGMFILAVNISAGLVPDNSITGKTTQEESVLYKTVAHKTFLIIEEAKIDR